MKFLKHLPEVAMILAWSGVCTLSAAEHRGVVSFHNLPIPGAVVTATQGDQKFTTSSGDDGTYEFRDLPDGTWTITVEMAGFARASREVGIMPGAPPGAFDLQLAAPQAPPPPAAATAPPTSTAAAAPPGGRGGPAAAGTPGAAPGGRGGPPMTPAQAQAMAKARATAALEMQDKAQSRAAAVAATTTQQGGGDSLTLAGSLGGGGGAGGMSFGNNMGGSQYNGNASFSLDNSVWDANSYSLAGIQTAKPAFAKGRVNLSFGGPLKIPHILSGKNSTFILNYSMGRTRNATTQSINVPTLAERLGDFSQSVVQKTAVVVYDPTTGQPFPGNIIPTSRINATARTLASYYPTPNAAASQFNYQSSVVSLSNQDNLNARLNHTFNKKDRISGSVGWQRSTGTNNNVFDFIDDTSNYGINVNASWNHTFSKRLIQNATFSFSRSRTELTPYFANLQQNIAQQLGIQGTSTLAQNYGPPNLSFTNFFGLSDGNASLSRNQTVNVGYSINLVRAKHQWTFGTDYRRQQINPFSDANGRGSFTFTGLATSAAGTGGYDFADFLLNLPGVASIRFGNADKYFRTWKFDWYASDNWQISKALTANLGLRWDYTAPYTEIYNRMANLNVGPGFTTASLAQAGSAGLPTSLIRPDYSGFSPNLGLGWRVFPKNPKMPTQVRFGYSTMHPMDSYGSISTNLAGQPPFAKSFSIASSTTAPFGMQNAFLSTPSFSNTWAINPDYKLLCVTQAMVILIQPLPKGYYAVGGYVYVKASHLDQNYLPNSLPPGVTVPTNGPPSGYIYDQSTGRLHGTVEVFQFGRNMSSGFSASMSLQRARVIDNGSITGMTNNLAQDWQNLNAEKATSPLVPQQQLSGNWQYSTGQGKAGGTLLKGWRGRLLKDWTITNGLVWRSGTPLTAMVGGTQSTVGGTGITGTVRADATGLSIDAPSGSNQPFNRAAFRAPATGHWGNAGRSTIIGPAIWGLNASLGRIFRLGERRSADLRFDANNVINHVVINGWSTVVNASNYGLPTGTQPMRSMTANLRFRF